MNTLFSLMLAVMCVVSFFQVCFAKNMEAFVIGTLAMVLSAVVFLIHAKYPLFNEVKK
jgi:hypothetical protein